MTAELDDFMRPIFENMPAMGGHYMCPVDGCSWSVDVPDSTTNVREAPDGGLTVSVSGVPPAHVEVVVSAHLVTHSTLDWASTIIRLRSRVAELERAQEES